MNSLVRLADLGRLHARTYSQMPSVRLVGNGRQLEIIAHRHSASDQYIQSVSFNGKPYTKSWFNHRDIANGARIVFEVGDKPNLEFGSQPADVPPSLTLESA